MTTIVALLCSSCQKEESALPSYREDLVCLLTDASGCVKQLQQDDGQRLDVSNKVAGLRPDSTYRALALYTLQADANKAWLTDYAAILAPQAKVYKNHVVCNPLSVVACWESGDYINLRLQIKGTNQGTHYFGFHEESVSPNAAGGSTVHIQLIHDQNNDPLYYTRETYLSLPLENYKQKYTSTHDSVGISAETFTGEAKWCFPLNGQL